MKISRSWAMPNSNTFEIKPIKELISKYEDSNGKHEYDSIRGYFVPDESLATLCSKESGREK